MKRIVSLICLAVVFSLLISAKTGVMHAQERSVYIGLHDRLLSFEQKEIKQVDGNVFVPFEKLMGNLYAEVTVNNELISAKKNSFIVRYNYETGKTSLDGMEYAENAVREIDGKLYADVAYIARSFGFNYTYLEQVNVYRITSNSYKSLSSIDYEQRVKTFLKIPDHHIGLHDRLLNFTQAEIRLIDGKTFVPFDKLMKDLYAEVTKKEKVIAVKNKHVLMYDVKTGITTVDEIESVDQPIREVNGQLYADMAYVAKSFGFNFDCFTKINTSRISSDTYKSLKGAAYEKHITTLLEKLNEPVHKPTPKPPTKPQKANVYLTFDDGPNASTTTNLATLKKYNVQGTFFFLGSQMNAYPALTRTAAKEGHYIGTHSMTHEQNKVYRSTDSFMNEMNTAVGTLEKLIGENSKLLRVPYGSVPHVTPAMRVALKNKSYKMWDWDVDSNDWRYSVGQYAQITTNVRVGVDKSYRAGDREIVVLLHDRPQTAKALPYIIEWLKKEGYTIKKYDPANHVIQNFRKDQGL